MTDPNYTAICLVVDRSGSIRDILSDAQGAIDAFLAKQKDKVGRTTVRLVQFDDSYELVYPSTDAGSLPMYRIAPRGMTALRDAFGRGITEFGEELTALPEDRRPGTVVFAIMTDGYENSSKEWTDEQLKSLIKQQQEEYNWAVTYLGANQDAVAEGIKMGVRAGASLTFGTTGEELGATADVLASYVVATASADPAMKSHVSYTPAQRSATRHS